MTASRIHMVKMDLSTRGLFLLAKWRNLPPHQTDIGYVVHCALRELFADASPHPFALLSRRGRRVHLLGYSQADGSALREAARLHSPAPVELDPAGIESKPMPTTWTVGSTYEFEITFCPVARMASDGHHHRKGAEVDAFLAACWRAGNPKIPVDRTTVYRDWLAKRLEAGGAQIQALRISRFQRDRLLRRTQGADRTSRLTEKPSATGLGLMQVADGDRFAELIRRGVGRHRAFGFGMLLLRQPSNVGC